MWRSTIGAADALPNVYADMGETILFAQIVASPAANRIVSPMSAYTFGNIAAPIVLLHTGYPYVRSLAYVAAMFPNVYADMGETILFAAGEATGIYRELLGLAPASKLLFSTDASLVPELYWIGARVGRQALARVLDEHIADGVLDEATALDWAERMLWRNAEAVYGL